MPIIVSRRTFLVTGLAGSVLLATAFRATRAWPVPSPERAARRFAPGTTAYAMMAALAAVLLDGALPVPASPRATAIVETVAVVEAALRGLPPATQRDLDRLFALLAFAPARVAIAGVMRPWAEASPTSVDAFLARWRASRLEALRSAYDALHQLVLAAWYGQPRSWAAIGYPGPPPLS